jgi:8-oxo-dGTP pyrophosphatase MutT (NUDIX family)
MTAPDKSAVRPAASIVLIRDGAQGIEAFMIDRHQVPGHAFSGYLVFPGGKVDAEDHVALPAHAPHPTADWPDVGFWVAAVRETFEEAGILLARAADGGPIVGGDLATRLTAEARAATDKRPDFADFLARAGLVPALDALVHYGHWITPTWAPRRFDTHFFLVAAPADQHVLLDAEESAHGSWMRPRDVIAQTDAGKHSLVAVTRFSLELLDSWGTVGEAMAAARRRRIVTVQPQREKVDGGWLLRIPEEAGYLRSQMWQKAGG